MKPHFLARIMVCDVNKITDTAHHAMHLKNLLAGYDRAVKIESKLKSYCASKAKKAAMCDVLADLFGEARGTLCDVMPHLRLQGATGNRVQALARQIREYYIAHLGTGYADEHCGHEIETQQRRAKGWES